MRSVHSNGSGHGWRDIRRASLAAALFVGGATTVVASSAAAGRSEPPAAKAVYEPRLEAPSSPNPYLSLLPDEQAGDVTGWNLYLNAAGKTRASKEAPGAPRQGLRVAEREAGGASTNGSQVTAERIRRFGTAPGSKPAAEIRGTTPPVPAGNTSEISIVELDGSLGTATAVPLSLGDSATGSGVIGDEPAPNGPPDFDFFRFSGLTQGQNLVIDLDTPEPFGDLDPFIAVWNPDLAPFEIAVNDDGPDSWDSFLIFSVPVDGDYYVSVGGFGAFVPEDGTDPASPSVTGEVGSEGIYDVTFSVLPPLDVDFYSFDLQAGDIVGATARGGGLRLELYGQDGTLLIGSSQDATFIHPVVSPLPGGGNASASFVVESAGTYALAVQALGDYDVDLRAFRPAKERTGNATQAVFVDFDGALIDPGIFFGGEFGFEVPLSPLSSFLPAWGLSPSDEDAVIDAILAAVEESLSEDVRALGGNGDRDAGDGPGAFDIEILNSRDHADRWGDQYVSRLIVGGTIEELGIGTVGIAQSIDVGDFESEESAVILLDLLSGTGPFPSDVDLNGIELDPSASIIDLIGIAVGNITAHEAGHFLANWHTDQFNASPNIQDQGGNFAGTFGLGPDGIFGSGDDFDVDFGPDDFVPNEGFAGTEDTLQSISFGLSTGAARGKR